MTYILPLAHKDASIEMTGSKGMSLSKMLLAGLPVPDGFHVTTEAYRAFVAANQMGAKIIGLLAGIAAPDTAGLERVSKEILMLFERGEMPSEVKSEIASAYAGLENAAVAVRSSATAEDLPDASFAGQQDSYLNIRGEKESSIMRQCFYGMTCLERAPENCCLNMEHTRLLMAMSICPRLTNLR